MRVSVRAFGYVASGGHIRFLEALSIQLPYCGAWLTGLTRPTKRPQGNSKRATNEARLKRKFVGEGAIPRRFVCSLVFKGKGEDPSCALADALSFLRPQEDTWEEKPLIYSCLREINGSRRGV
ncbi:unnamed protein product, partial [Iphiclides podalirius]